MWARVGGMLAASALVAGCATTSRSACRNAGARVPRRSIDVAHALQREGKLVTVDGVLVASHGRPRRLCSSSGRSPAAHCGEPSLRVEGLRDLAAFEGVDRRGEVQVVGSARIGGRVEGHTLRVTMSCRADRVRERFAEATDEALSLNTFASTDEVEVLDVASLPELVPRAVRARYGVFGISVETPEARGPNELLDAPPGSFRWIRARGRWIAVKRYGDHLALTWLAGPRQRLDGRWRRLSRIVSGLG